MSKIIGNQEHRTSKVDTEKWKEHAEYYKNKQSASKLREKKKAVYDSNNFEEIKDLANVLRYDKDGIPMLRLVQFKDMYIQTSTGKDYDTVMQIFESGGWIHKMGVLATDTNYWKKHGSETCIPACDKFDMADLAVIDDFFGSITPQEFYQKQKITTGIIGILNEWYDTNKPNRTSRPK